jgi:aminoglycoside 6-adenylyltransferase
LFTDGNRIDLTLFPLDKLTTLLEEESLLRFLMDKDNLVNNFPPPGEKAYLIKPPTEKEFNDCCNEFWWVSTYVAKGLYRKEIIYAHTILENPVRIMFLKLIEWYIGITTSFTVSFGKNGRNIQRYLSPEIYHHILATYPDSNVNNTWEALFLMVSLYNKLATEVATKLKFGYNEIEADNVMNYLKYIYAILMEE